MREAGLIQVDLLGFKLDKIDADDLTLDFAGDVVYRYNAADDFVSLQWLDFMGKRHYASMREKPLSAMQMMDRAAAIPGAPAYFADQRDDLPLLRTYGVASMLRSGATDFAQLYGRNPRSWEELAASHCCGLDMASIGPWNGRPLDGRGGPHGITIRKSHDSANFFVGVMGADGKPLPRALIF